MARLKKTRAEQLTERFGEAYRIGKARCGMTNAEIAEMIGLKTQTTLKRRRGNPAEFTLGQLLAMGAAFRWTLEDYAHILAGPSK